MVVSLDENEIKILQLLDRLGKADVNSIKTHLNRNGTSMPHSTVASILDRLYEMKLVEREEVKSRGRYGKKHLYFVGNLKEDLAKRLVEEYIHLVGENDLNYLRKEVEKEYIHGTGDSVAFVDSKDRVIFLHTDGKTIERERLLGKDVFSLHPPLTRKFVQQLIHEMKKGTRNEYRRYVKNNDKTIEKIYSKVESPEGEYLGVIVITRILEDDSKIS